MDFSIVVLGILVGYSFLAFFDGILLHLWKYKLYSFPDTFYEHILHSIRATIFPFLLVGLFYYDLRGFWFIVIFSFVILDLLVQGFDMWEENNARKRFGGLSSIEYILHVVLSSLHVSMVLLYVLIKPIESWRFDGYEVLPSSALNTLVVLNLLPGALVVATLHWILALPKFRVKKIS